MTTPRIRTIHAYGAVTEALREAARAAFPDCDYRVWATEEEFVAGIEEAEALLVFRPPRGHWGRARRLLLLQMIGAGVDSVLPAPELPERVLLANARGVHEPEMSEFVLGLILAVAKRLPMAMAQQHEREWKLYVPHGLSGRTLGVLGLGTIGQAVAGRAAALGMRVIGTRRNPEPVADVAEVLPPSKTRRVLAESDVVVVVLPHTPETEGLLDAEAIASMKPGAHLVNVARGGIVDEAALAEALREGRLGSRHQPALGHAKSAHHAARRRHRQRLHGAAGRDLLREHPKARTRRANGESGRSRPGLLSGVRRHVLPPRGPTSCGHGAPNLESARRPEYPAGATCVSIFPPCAARVKSPPVPGTAHDMIWPARIGSHGKRRHA